MADIFLLVSLVSITLIAVESFLTAVESKFCPTLNTLKQVIHNNVYKTFGAICVLMNLMTVPL